MSFVITAVSPETVVQVSETRLSSLSDSSLICDDQRKSIIVAGKEAHFVVGWVGLARTNDGHDTGDWLWRQLYEMNALELPLVRIAGDLAGSATRHFATLNISSRHKRSEFVLGGWQKISGVPTPFTCVIQNDLIFHQAHGHEPPAVTSADVAAPEFMYSINSFLPVKAPFLVTIIGDFDACALRSHFRGLKGLLKRHSPTAAISAHCRQITLEVARGRRKTVGTNLIAVEMDNKGATQCSYYPADREEVMLIPDILTTRGALIKGTVSGRVVGDEVKVRLRGSVVKQTIA